MGLFSKRASGPTAPRVRSGDCVYLGEPFPTARERIVIAGIEVDFLFNQDAVPNTWTAMVGLIRESSGEPNESRVLINILGTLLAMADHTFTSMLGPGLELEAAASQASTQLREGVDILASYRQLFASHPDGAVAFDFELIKIASLLASPRSAGARSAAAWPHPDLFNGDLTLFHLS